MVEPAPSTEGGFADWREFLTSNPPGARAQFDRAATKSHYGDAVWISCPELRLYCDGECSAITHCNGKTAATGRLFGSASGGPSYPTPQSPGANRLPFDAVILYTCEKCLRIVKNFSVRVWGVAPSPDTVGIADIEKIAEWPQFAPRTPGKLISLVGSSRELFMKGRRAEIEGMGIGAFAYYRRIIETQKNHLIEEIIRVARHLAAPPESIELLEAAKNETQFSRAVDSVKDAIPSVLCIKGHNPLTLLHSALSQGLHNDTDEVCLQSATDIRLILIAFAERLAEAMREQRELEGALTRLVNRRS